MKSSLILAVIALAVIAITCSEAGQQHAATTGDDMIAVNRMLVSLDRIAAEADVEAFITYVSDDCVMMPPNEPALVGKHAIRRSYELLYENFTIELKHEPLETDVFGDLIIHRGNAEYVATPKTGGESVSFDNKYLFVIKKQPDGSLRIWRAVFNSNTPAPTG